MCDKSDIGLKATGNGMIAVTNWQMLSDADEEEIEAGNRWHPRRDIDPRASDRRPVAADAGQGQGNGLDVLDRRYARGGMLEYLAGLPDLMVFNDEAHHIHEFRREGETTEVEWQKSL